MSAWIFDNQTSEPLEWALALSAPDEWRTPADIDARSEWLPAKVPGTAADALRDAGRLDMNDPVDFDRLDVWYRTIVPFAGCGRLTCEGLATISEIWIAGRRALSSVSMFLESQIEAQFVEGETLLIAFRALGPHLDAPAPRARWRPANIRPANLRLFRTTLLGRMPGWAPPIHAAGPWRPVRLARLSPAPRVAKTALSSRLANGQGEIEAVLRVENDDGGEAFLQCEGRSVPFTRETPGRLRAVLTIDPAEPWFPHCYGAPRLYSVSARLDGCDHLLGRIGFRTIAIERGAGDDFALRVNGELVFCRGAVWTNPDIVALPCSREAYEPLLRAMAEANLNMTRVSGAMTYEAAPFFDLCDELGILVWQDLMFSNFDYPDSDANFVDLCRRETEQLLTRLGANPSLAVICGGSEMAQQAAMLGLPAKFWTSRLFDEALAATASRLRPDCAYVSQTPMGTSGLPFAPASGLCHYYGVSAYKRPIEDARLSGVRFAPECLGHANLSDGLTPQIENDAPALVQPCWRDRRANDVGALWYFEDVRNFYMHELYGVDPAQIRLVDPSRYVDLSKATNAEIITDVFAQWRRCGSATAGALVWFWRDIAPCAGWGFLDSEGRPKSVWFALRRACRPIQVLLIDEGLNGLYAHLINETASVVDATLAISCLRDGATPVMRAERNLLLQPRSVNAIADNQLFGAFFDAAYSYRFGPASHDVTIASLVDRSTGALLSDAFHFPIGRGNAQYDLNLRARVDRDQTGWFLLVETDRFAQSIHIDDRDYRGEEDWFHLPPGASRMIRLKPVNPKATTPRGALRAINGVDRVFYDA